MGHITGPLLALLCLNFCSVQAQSLWREDGRCGEEFPLPDGSPGQCDPAGDGPRKGPCCSPKGFCGNTDKHCKCGTCVDYSKMKETLQPAPETRKTSNLVQTMTMARETVQTRSGEIQGTQVVSEEGVTHYEFHGIPYAQPPVDKLRFKPPRPIRPWTDTLDASKKGPYCWQVQDLAPGPAKEMSEDCLHLSIYTSNVDKPYQSVMIWIHGGGFTQGSGNDYTPTSLIREGVIVVSINYRLGPFGFLTFGNDLVSGNMGLKDQALAIQWVKQNIGKFGGNPNKITIFGESAGGMSVHAHVLSPWNFGQIQGAIAQSGTMLYYKGLRASGEREERYAKHAGEKLCSETELNQSVLQCLQSVDAKILNEKLSLKVDEYFSLDSATPFEWRPVIDNYAENPFLPLDPLEAMKTGTFNRIPFISGTVKNEGALWIGLFASQGQREQIEEQWASYGPPMIFSDSSNTEFTPAETLIANISLRYYNHPQGETQVETDQPLMDLLTDATFISPDQKTVEAMSEHTDRVFNYYLTQQTDNSLLAGLFNQTMDYTPVHGDDLVYLMDIYGMKLNLSEQDSALSTHMVKYWTNFAKYGHPSPSTQDDLPFWDSVTPTKKRYLELRSSPVMGENLLAERMEFWERMLWAGREEMIERKMIFNKATQYLLDNNL